MVDEEDYRMFVNLWQNLVTIAENARKISKDKRMRYEVKTGQCRHRGGRCTSCQGDRIVNCETDPYLTYLYSLIIYFVRLFVVIAMFALFD